MGRYILTPAIFDRLGDEPVYAFKFEGTRYDCGSKLGYLRATVEYALRHPDLGSRFKDYLQTLAD